MKQSNNNNNNKKTGRPTVFKKEYIDLAYKFCLLGATNDNLGIFLGGVNKRTIDRWIKSRPTFCRAVKKGRGAADAHVAERLYSRACGFVTREIKIKKIKGEEHIETIEKEIPPDPTSMIFWLKNRQPELWRDVKRIHSSGKVDVGATISDETAKKMADLVLKNS